MIAGVTFMSPPKEEKDQKKALPVIKDDYGNIVNPYIPRFIVQTPWYVAPKNGEQTEQSPLEHQKVHSEEGPKTEIKDTEKSIFSPQIAYKRGACENCGAVTHKTRDCVERPKLKGSKWTGISSGAEVVIKTADQSFDAKRDRWHGYNPNQYDEILEARKADLDKREPDCGSEDEDDAENVGGSLDIAAVKATKQLRIREDTVKYLKDLHNEKGAYDPKTRSMRDMFDTSESFIPSDSKAASERVFAWQENREAKNASSIGRSTTASLERHIDKNAFRNGSKGDPRYNY
jgi:pre-mRNA-processing factor SLU7